MKNNLILIAMAIYGNAFGQQHIVTYYDVFKKQKQEVYDLDAKGEKNGKYTSYFADGKVESERNYIHGKLNGKETVYYTDGYRYGLAHVYNYKNDKQDGLQHDYIVPEQGEMNNLGFHKSPAKEKFYGSTDANSWEKIYDEYNGKRYLSRLIQNGIEKGYNVYGRQQFQKTDNGHNFQEADSAAEINKSDFNTISGKKEGVYREWYPNGKLADSCFYKDNFIEGLEMHWYSNGRLKDSGYVRHGALDGLMVIWDIEGTVLHKYSYHSGVRDFDSSDLKIAWQYLRDHDYLRADDLFSKLESAGLLKNNLPEYLNIGDAFKASADAYKYCTKWYNLMMINHQESMTSDELFSVGKKDFELFYFSEAETAFKLAENKTPKPEYIFWGARTIGYKASLDAGTIDYSDKNKNINWTVNSDLLILNDRRSNMPMKLSSMQGIYHAAAAEYEKWISEIDVAKTDNSSIDEGCKCILRDLLAIKTGEYKWNSKHQPIQEPDLYVFNDIDRAKKYIDILEKINPNSLFLNKTKQVLAGTFTTDRD